MASIGEPFLLSTYAQPKRTKSTPILTNVNQRASSLYASQPEASSSKYVTVAASGDGVHVLDVSTWLCVPEGSYYGLHNLPSILHCFSYS